MPTRKLPDRLKTNARRLRHDMTDAEFRLWYHLRRHSLVGFKFRRQHPFGPYILDFYCPEANLVVEVDGSQHYDPKQSIRDAERTIFLEARGLRVLRFNDRDVLKDTTAVLEAILTALGHMDDPPPATETQPRESLSPAVKKGSHQSPPPSGERPTKVPSPTGETPTKVPSPHWGEG